MLMLVQATIQVVLGCQLHTRLNIAARHPHCRGTQKPSPFCRSLVPDQDGADLSVDAQLDTGPLDQRLCRRDAQAVLNIQAAQSLDDALWVDLVERGYPPGQVIWFYKLDTDRDIQGRYPRGWREFDFLVSTATLRSFPDNLPQAREAQRRSRVVASFGSGTQRVEIRKVQGSPM